MSKTKIQKLPRYILSVTIHRDGAPRTASYRHKTITAAKRAAVRDDRTGETVFFADYMEGKKVKVEA